MRQQTFQLPYMAFSADRLPFTLHDSTAPGFELTVHATQPVHASLNKACNLTSLSSC